MLAIGQRSGGKRLGSGNIALGASSGGLGARSGGLGARAGGIGATAVKRANTTQQYTPLNSPVRGHFRVSVNGHNVNVADYNNSIAQRNAARAQQQSSLSAPIEAENAVNEAREKTEASKTAALGYYDDVDSQLAGMGDLISPEQQKALEAKRKDQLAASGQSLASAFGDSDSGVSIGQRSRIATDIAGRAADLPIETQLDVASQNRAAKMSVIGQRTNIANSKSNIQQNYEYDPGLEYINQLGSAQGQASQVGSSTGIATRTSSGSYSPWKSKKIGQSKSKSKVENGFHRYV